MFSFQSLLSILDVVVVSVVVIPKSNQFVKTCFPNISWRYNLLKLYCDLCNIFGQVINAGNFWAHPIASPGSEFQDFMGKLNDHFRKSTTSQAVPQLVKGQVSTITTTMSSYSNLHVHTLLQ